MLCIHSNGGLFTCEDKLKVNAQVSNGGKVPKKPRGCNCDHITKALEHLTGLANLQPSHKPPMPGLPQAPVTLEPDSSVERKNWEDGEGTPRTTKLVKFNPQCHANRAMNTLQAHGMKTHELTKNNAGQCQPQGSHNQMTAANAIECTKR